MQVVCSCDPGLPRFVAFTDSDLHVCRSATSSGMTAGATSTLETPPAEPETTIAVPAVKAQPFGGSGS
jgi:hypothetical protein